VADGMLSAGFRVLGVDIVARKGYPAPLLLQDVRTLERDLLPAASWVHASPPCQRFSKARASRVSDPPTDADCDILRACLDLRDDIKPRFWTVENVSGAVALFEPYLGKPRFQHGPFYLWGCFPSFLVESAGLKKGMSTWGLDPETGVRTWGVKKDRPAGGERNRTPVEITAPLARAIMAELRPLRVVGNLEATE
jgi:hypothetical protein